MKSIINLLFITLSCTNLAPQNMNYFIQNQNASFFSIQERKNYLSQSTDPLLKNLTWKNFDCSISEIPDPVSYHLTMSPKLLILDRLGQASNPLLYFENETTKLAKMYFLTNRISYANCLVDILYKWADKKSLSSFSYTDQNQHTWIAVTKTLAAASMNYSLVKNAVAQDEKLKIINDWFASRIDLINSFPGNAQTCCDHNSNWRGLASMMIAVINNNHSLFSYAIEKYKFAIESLNSNGSFPLEVKQTNQDIQNQNQAILPLIYMAEIASLQGVDLYGFQRRDLNIHSAINFLISHLNLNKSVKNNSSPNNGLDLISNQEELNWVEPYLQKFPNSKLEKIIKSIRPIEHRLVGGNSTLYFYRSKI